MKRRNLLRYSSLLFLTPAVSWARAVTKVFKNHLRSLSSEYLFPGDKGFNEAIRLFNLDLKPPEPTAVLKSSNSRDYGESFQDEQVQQEKWFLRSGGHSFAGFSIGHGLVFDSRTFNDFRVNGENVILGSGLTLVEAQKLLEPYGLVIPNGTCPVVGLAGYILGGGHSNKSRTWGLGCDRVEGMEVILASGEEVFVSPRRHSDLYWALLGGGGGNFAMVKNFHLRAFRSRGAARFAFHFSGARAQEIFEFWENKSFDEESNTSVAFFIQARNGEIEKVRVTGHIHDVAQEQVEEAFFQTLWTELKNFDPSNSSLQHRSAHYMRPLGIPYPFVGSSQYAEHKIGRVGFKAIEKAIGEHINGSSIGVLMEPLGGKISQPSHSNSYPHRHCRYVVELNSTFLTSSKAHVFKENFHNFNRAIDPLFSGRRYVNYCDLQVKDWANAYYAQNLAELLRIKRRYDPQNRFDFGDQSLSHLI